MCAVCVSERVREGERGGEGQRKRGREGKRREGKRERGSEGRGRRRRERGESLVEQKRWVGQIARGWVLVYAVLVYGSALDGHL